VALLKSTGTAPCLLGKTWGYDDTGIWVSDGCSGEFLAGPARQEQSQGEAAEYIPNLGFLLYSGEKGEIYFRLFSYARYLNQRRSIRPMSTPSATPKRAAAPGHPAAEILRAIQRWFLTPKFRYYLYVWSSNPRRRSRAGRRRRQPELHLQPLRDVGGGITSLPPCAAPRASSRTGSASTTA
jgi:hypothetical protein